MANSRWAPGKAYGCASTVTMLAPANWSLHCPAVRATQRAAPCRRCHQLRPRPVREGLAPPAIVGNRGGSDNNAIRDAICSCWSANVHQTTPGTKPFIEGAPATTSQTIAGAKQSIKRLSKRSNKCRLFQISSYCSNIAIAEGVHVDDVHVFQTITLFLISSCSVPIASVIVAHDGVQR